MEKYQTALWIVYGVGVVLVPIIMGFCIKPKDCGASYWGEGVIATLTFALLWPLVAVVALAICVFIIAAILIGVPIYCLVVGLMCVGSCLRQRSMQNERTIGKN